jgi:polysaccharide deacetylase 2 family uncharacterized protein YibQ
MNDDLNAPLGRRLSPQTKAPGAPARSFAAKVLPAAAATLAAAGAAALFFLPRDPYAGQPHAVARIEPYKPPPVEAAPQIGAAETTRTPDDMAHGNGRDRVSSVSEIESQSGVKITRHGESDASTAVIIQIDKPAAVRLAAAPDKRVAEKGRYGLLPKIGADGAKPMDIYARPFVTSGKIKTGAPRVALVVGGVGLNAASSAAAIEELPEEVTLAFAPYGANLDALAARARSHGHEIVLQAPMEPFDYPQNNPGPHTLVTGAADGLDDLHWLLSRFSGYAGVMNFLGARFTADQQALTPALGDIAQRGLFYLDDGSSPQSQAATVAARAALPNARVDVTLDARQTPQSLDAALAQLEALARKNGSAIGFANAMPATITRLARFARDLERRGVALAPVTATLSPARALSDRTDPSGR